ncbi:MAG: prepilin peptidase [Candidatus Paceibacterota bacterium]
MFYYFSTFVFLFGIIIGSFLNVVILRYNTGKNINGRSACFSCGKTLQWFELFPVLSFIFLKGKCRSCKTKISWQYPIVEFLTGLMFLGLYVKFFDFFIFPQYILLAFLYAIIFCILMVITVYDAKHKIIPDGAVYSFIVFSFITLLFRSFYFGGGFQFFICDIITGLAIFLFFFSLWFFSSGKWMGFGDAKLALGIGWSLGFPAGISAIVFAFWIGAAVGVALIIFKYISLSIVHTIKLPKAFKHLTIKSEIPFAPFLVLGMVLVFFFNLDLFLSLQMF